MLAVHDLEIRVGARTLMSEVSFRVSDGDKIGLVGRNGAGKTTLTKVLAGDLIPANGRVDSSGELGYLPQDPRSGDPEMLARTRILDARGLGTLALQMHEASLQMGDADEKVAAKAMRRYGNLMERFEALGGYAAESEAASIAHNLSLPDRILDQPLKTLSGGQRRRIELARILFSDAQTMILDEPTNHLDADSVVWLREFLKGYKGGLIVISHDVELVAGEPRVLQLYVRDGATRDVAARWHAAEDGRSWVLTRDEAIAAGLYGSTVDAEVIPRIGDVLVAARGVVAYYDDRVADKKPQRMIGQHGSLTDQERIVPLIRLGAFTGG